MQDKTAPQPAVAMPRIDAATTDFLNLHEIVGKARTNLDQNIWDYIVGGAETETTLRRNRMALDSIAFRPRVLRDVSTVDATVERFGRTLRLPVMLAPVGSLESMHPEGAAAIVRGVGEFGAAHMLSSVCEPPLEAVAEAAPDATRIFQLYVRGDDAFVDDHVSRAIDNGYVAFCLTVDTAHYSRRERDIAKRYQTAGRRRVAGRAFQMALDWRSVKRIKDRYKIPLALKGIATAEDARIAVEHGVEWVYISNHGGRQLDHGRGSMDVLPEVVDAVAGRAKILIDGGFYRGSDIVKAIALGADLIGIGRMQCYALAAAGQAGIVRLLELLEDEVQRCLGLLGVTRFAELDRSYLHPAAPVVTPPHVLSAFPLLKIDDYRY
jgi:isopentenyl diphosphate isomerase/L-lactate dehydrogenase-like FMN-dependent dehydrogenase